MKIFRDKAVLSPHYVPETLLHREEEIKKISKILSPLGENVKPRNLFIYGKTGTGKTCTIKSLIGKFDGNSKFFYMNCKMYATQFRVMEKLIKELHPSIDTSGKGLSFLFEKMLEWCGSQKKNLVIVLDEIDAVRDLDDLIYMLTRSNDELKGGSVTIIGISNKLTLKDRLGARSRSTLYEDELHFPPYNSKQLHSILKQRAQLGLNENSYEDGALHLAAAAAAQETGDARYALNLLEKAGKLAEERNEKISENHVEMARRLVDEDIVVNAICSLPDHSQLVLYALAHLTNTGSRYPKLDGADAREFFLSGELFEQYNSSARKFRKEARSARWFRDSLNELENLGLITMIESGKGQRGRTRLIRIAYPAEKVLKIVELGFS